MFAKIFVLPFFICALVEFAYSQEGCSPEGVEIRRATAYYRCIHRRLVISGCLGINDTKVPVNGIYRAFDSYDMKCIMAPGNANWANLVKLTCWLSGKQYKPGETFINGRYWYTCVQTNDLVRSVLSGCVGDGNEKVSPNGIFRSGDFLFTCTRMGDTVYPRPLGCMFGKTQVMIGREFADENYVHLCHVKNNVIHKSLIGCVYNNEKYYPGQQYKKNGFIFQCLKNASGISHSIIGCTGANNQSYALGEQWTDGDAPYKLVYECIMQNKGTVLKRVAKCAYEHEGKKIVLDPGCIQKIGKMLVRCLSLGLNGAGYHVTYMNPMSELEALAVGYKYC